MSNLALLKAEWSDLHLRGNEGARRWRTGGALRHPPAPRFSRGTVTELCESVNLDPGFRRGDGQAVWVLLIIRLAAGFAPSFRHPGEPVQSMPQVRKGNVRKRG